MPSSNKTTENTDTKTCDNVHYRLKNFKNFKLNKKSFSKSFESGEFKWKFFVDNDTRGFISCFIQLNFDWWAFFFILEIKDYF